MVDKVCTLSINASYYGKDVIARLKTMKLDDVKEWLHKKEEEGDNAFSYSEVEISRLGKNDSIVAEDDDMMMIWFI